MKRLFIEAKYLETIELPLDLINELPEEIAIFSSVQFLDSLKGIKKQLEEDGKKVLLFKPKHCQYDGQLLGCSIDKFNAKSFLYIGDGKFHPKALMIKNDADVFSYNPFNKQYCKIVDKDIEQMQKKIKGGILKFLVSDNIGVLISIKPGQYEVKGAEKLREKYPDKNFYFLMFDTLDFNSLQDFNFLDCYVNTACPRMIDDWDKFDRPLVNVKDLLDLE